ncbi:MAG: hypothetical protein ACLFQ9_08110 [Desulfobacterales bacterium]
MNIKIPVHRHCIETAIKGQYNRAVSKYFKAGRDEEKKDLESRIELLHHALETLDFNFLRNRYRDLRGESGADVYLGGDGENGQLYITINGEKIETTDKD